MVDDGVTTAPREIRLSEGGEGRPVGFGRPASKTKSKITLSDRALSESARLLAVAGPEAYVLK